MPRREAGRGGEERGKQTRGTASLELTAGKKQRNRHQCIAEVTALHFQGKTVCV